MPPVWRIMVCVLFQVQGSERDADADAGSGAGAQSYEMVALTEANDVGENGEEKKNQKDLTWVEDVSRGCLRGRTAVVTGASRGIGLAVAHTLASVAGAHTILACRNMTACKLTAQGMQSRSPGAAVECLPLNLESLSSVEDFAAQLSPRTGGPRPVHVLVHNAGALPASCFGPLAMSVCSSSHSAL